MQTTAGNQAVGLAGLLHGIARRVISYLNNTKKTDAVTITAADLATTCTINGTAFTVNSGAASLTKTELRDLLITAINAGAEPVYAILKDADELYVLSDTYGVTTTVVGTTNCSVAVVLPNEASVPFGRFVCLDQNVGGQGADNVCRLPFASADITDAKLALGFALWDNGQEQALLNAGNLGYVGQSAISVLQQGEVWVLTEEAVTAGGAVYVRYVAGAGEALGTCRSDADTSDAAVLPSAKYVTSTTGAGLARVQLNLP